MITRYPPLFSVIVVLLVIAIGHGCTSSPQSTTPAGAQRGLDAIRIDTEIGYQADRALVGRQPMSTQSHIVVTTFNRVILLTGQTPKAQWRQQAEQVVRRLPRVRQVYNELEVGPPASLPALSQDGFITSSVKTALIRSDDVSGNAVKVVTESGVVYLMGLVTRRQADAAADLTRRVSGVNKVVLLFDEV
jgi:osmotically-inducible protein OsmY